MQTNTKLNLGCVSFTLFLGVMFSEMLLIWPIASLLGMGTWTRVASRGGSKGGWHFDFFPEFQSFELLFWVLGFGLGASLLWRSRRPATTRQRNDSFKHLPQASPTALGLRDALAETSERLIVEFDSQREAQMDTRVTALFIGFLYMVVGAQLANALLAPWLGQALGPVRWLTVALALTPGLSRVFRGFGAWRQRIAVDDRLLLDFRERTVAVVDLMDPAGRPSQLARFDDVAVSLHRVKDAQGQCRVTELRLDLSPPVSLLKCYQEEERVLLESLARRLAELMGVELRDSQDQVQQTKGR